MKMRSRAAVRHGLSVPFSRGLSQQADALAAAMAGARLDEGTLLFAKVAAEAMIEVQRARRARAEFLNGFAKRDMIFDEALLLHSQRTERYERRAWSRRRKAMQVL